MSRLFLPSWMKLELPTHLFTIAAANLLADENYAIQPVLHPVTEARHEQRAAPVGPAIAGC